MHVATHTHTHTHTQILFQNKTQIKRIAGQTF